MNTEDIKQQLEKIVNCNDFKSKPMMCRFLSYLVNEKLESRGDQIKGYSIGVDVFKQGAKFDPDQNALVRINAGRLRRLLKMYYLEEGRTDSIKIEIPKGRYVPKITIEEPKTNHSRLPLPAQKNFNSITVLPFKNLSENKEYDYYCYGFSQGLSSQLSKFDDLQVVGSAFQENNLNINSQLLEKLEQQGVGFVIEGDMMVFGNQSKLTVRLLETNHNTQLWGEGFKFNLKEHDLFDVQENIILQLSNILGSEIGQINQRKYENLLANKPTSYSEEQVLLKWYFYQTKLSIETHQDLYETISITIQKEPESALLNALMANLYGNAHSLDIPGLEGAYEKSGAIAEKAFALNPRNQIVQAIMAQKTFNYNERDRFFHLVEEGLNAAPHSPLRLGVFAQYSCLFGEWEKGEAMLDQVFTENLNFPIWLYGVRCLRFYRIFDYEKALNEANRYYIPMFFWGPLLRIAVLGQLNRKKDAVPHIKELLEIRPDFKEKAKYLIGLHIKESALLEHIMEGLVKAGVGF